METISTERACLHCFQVKHISEFKFKVRGRCLDCRKQIREKEIAKKSKDAFTRRLSATIRGADLDAVARGFRTLFRVYGGQDGFVQRMKTHVLFLTEHQQVRLQADIAGCFERHKAMLRKHQDDMLAMVMDDMEAGNITLPSDRVEYWG